MAETYNVYLDESCHLEHDQIPVMVLGAVWCPLDATPQISRRVQEIKRDHGLPPEFEIKWVKVSPGGQKLYLDLLNLFFDDDDLHFRGIVIPDKSLLDHSRYSQDHDQWYYKMCFTLLEPIVSPRERYCIYLDIKDTHSAVKGRKLREVLCNSRYDFGCRMIERVQPIRSEESPVLQLADLLIGALAHRVRGLQGSEAKQRVIERIQERTHWPLGTTTWLREPKFNVLRWQAGGGP